jgi:bifunctional enzyme CysN/CysC
VRREQRAGVFRLPVQWVNRPEHDFRGFSGTIATGAVRVGDAVKVLPSGTRSTVRGIVTFDGSPDEAGPDQAVTIVLEDEIDVSRGDVICAAEAPDHAADQFDAHIVWMHDHELVPGRPYLMKLAGTTVGMTVSSVRYKVNVNTAEHLAAKTLHLNEIGDCQIATDRPIPYTPYDVSRDLGGFIVVDRITNATVGAGMLRFALRRAENIPWQHVEVTPDTRSELMGHPAAVVWLTGLSGAGKSTIANATEKQLHALGIHTFLLDGDNLRHGLTRDLGFTEVDRVENIRRAAEAARLMADAGLVVLVSLISPFRTERALARELVGDDRFCEVYVDTPLEVAEERDPKGLYAKARRGELMNFTGIDSPYEEPEAPDVRLDTNTLSPEQAAEALVSGLRAMGLVPR